MAQARIAAAIAEREVALEAKVHAASEREVERRAAQAALVEACRVADARAALAKESHRARQLSHRGGDELRVVTEQLSIAQLDARTRARKAAVTLAAAHERESTTLRESKRPVKSASSGQLLAPSWS